MRILKKLENKLKGSDLPDLLDAETIRVKFQAYCRELEIDPKEAEQLIIYELTDGTRTSTKLSGWEAYHDGSLFVTRLVHVLDTIGCKMFYVLTVGEGHKARDNWDEMMLALDRTTALWKEYVSKYNVRMKFVGNFEGLEGEGVEEFKRKLKELEALSAKNTGMVMLVLINYSADWAYGDTRWRSLPNANVIVKHTKGQVNEGLWLPGKLQNNSFVYVQQGSCSSTWDDDQIIWLAALATRSMILHKGRQYGKSYMPGEIEEIRQKREVERTMVHLSLSDKPTKRVVMFSHVGPEIYEF